MNILGFEAGAQVIILQGLSTYAALFSALSFAKPILREQVVRSRQEILRQVHINNPDLKRLYELSDQKLSGWLRIKGILAERDNKTGLYLLIVSFLLLSLAIYIQVNTDPLFHPAEKRGSEQLR